MDPVTIGALIAMVAGSAMQYKATNDAAKRQAEEVRRSLARQDQYQRQAEKKALDQAAEMNTDTRMQNQVQIEDQLAQEFAQPAQSAQQINASASTTQGDVSGDYTTAKAKSDLAVLKANDVLARLMAKTGSANKLRGNEALRIADTAAGIDRLGNFSRGQAGADQLAINAAGRPDAGLMLGGQLLQGVGTMGMMSGAGAASSGVPAYDGASTASAWQGAAGGTTGATGTAAIGGTASTPFAAGGRVGMTAGRSTIPISFAWGA